ncbi:S24 family peptidase, partial [Acinetobacter baumannii]|nr:S24 family peptidase [Acinetobacter baumannii]
EVQHGIARTTFKKYRVIGINEFGVDVVELVPLNPDYPTYNSTQIEISIIGVVVRHNREITH